MTKTNPSFSITGQKFNVVILAAGFGTRLRPLTDHLPKALVEVTRGMRAIDHLIKKYQYVAEKIIIAVGYGAELLKNYVLGKYPKLNIVFSREKEEDLKGPGRSLTFALDYADSNLPTIITFCDYLLEDYINVDSDALCICEPKEGTYILDTYRNKVTINNGIIINVIENEEEENPTHGFTGIAIIHHTILLKSIVYTAATLKDPGNVDYTFDIIKPYISKIKTIPFPIHKQYEFGTTNNLIKIKEIFENGNN
jgi:NDP-sugar pyrophosphorylase family protein